MKLKIVSVLSLVILFASCSKDKVFRKYKAKVPVYTSYEEFRAAPEFESPKQITKKGNIYIKNQFLFVVEPHEGVHFIDNSNPSSPINTGFLKLKGVSGVAIKGNHLYANTLIDLVVMDVSDMSNPIQVSRSENAFPDALPLTELDYPMGPIDKELGVVTGWKVEDVKIEVEDGNQPISAWGGAEMMLSDGTSNYTGGGAGATGIAGSIAKMTIVNDYLYVMDNHSLKPFNISTPSAPICSEGVSIWREVETLFPYQDKIFMGTTSGMLIYGTTNPEVPNHISSIDHAMACDPVVVQGDYAYVTIRTGTTCMGELNQLDVVDISDINNPILQNSFGMTNPHGLGIDGNSLFICDGADGLKMFDATNPLDCGNNQVASHSNIQATDIIPFNNVAIVIGDDGIYQYDYSDNQNLQLLSKISF